MLSTYTLFKFLHVVGAILWVGGISTLTVLYLQVTRVQDWPTIGALLRASAVTGRALVGPAAALTLVAGIATGATGGLDFGMLWLTWGFVGILASIALGATLIRRTTTAMDRIVADATSGNSTTEKGQLRALQQRLTRLNLLNLLILLSTVGAMVLKPTL